MRKALLLLALVPAGAATAGPVPILRMDGFSFGKWNVLCSGLRQGSAACEATRKVGNLCLHMAFNSSYANLSLTGECDASGRPIETIDISMPLSVVPEDQQIPSSLRAFIRAHGNGAARNAMTNQFVEEAEDLAFLLHRITRERP
ncbi:MAG: hypothetical protein JO013_13870 [Alphaproteobacteria bacterium]|nr:hypothetical protein [Alphaproteobacteria bacterium]